MQLVLEVSRRSNRKTPRATADRCRLIHVYARVAIECAVGFLCELCRRGAHAELRELLLSSVKIVPVAAPRSASGQRRHGPILEILRRSTRNATIRP
jgi:hypothetical protein